MTAEQWQAWLMEVRLTDFNKIAPDSHGQLWCGHRPNKAWKLSEKAGESCYCVRSTDHDGPHFDDALPKGRYATWDDEHYFLSGQDDDLRREGSSQ